MNTSMHPIIIIGSGLASYSLLREIRKHDQDVAITIITADDGHAYAKPNLSNAFAQGKTAEALAQQTATQIASNLNAEILTRTQVTKIDVTQRCIHTNTTNPIIYQKLVLAIGADPIQHGVQGQAAEHILTVNNLDDYHRFRATILGKKRITILGGGLIGCEFAHDLAHAGYAVQVVHLGPWPLERLLPKPCGQALSHELEQLGIQWHFGKTAKHIDKNEQNDEIVLTLNDGNNIKTDVVLSAIGLKPRTDLAAKAGINVQRGIVVNRSLATSHADIYAMGDCIEMDGTVLPFVQPIMHQARALGATLTGTLSQVNYPTMPIIVKTPTMPVVIASPQQGVAGDWKILPSNNSIDARFMNESQELLGFALMGQATGLRHALTKELSIT